MTMNQDTSIEASLVPFIKAILGRKALGTVVLDVGALTSLADFFIICSGRSHRQVTSIGEFVLVELKKQGIKPLRVAGLKEGHWVLMDYGHIIIHIFFETTRQLYDLEGLWVDAKRINIDAYQTENNNVLS